MSDYWDNTPEDEVFDDERAEDGETLIFVNGSYIPVEPGTSFVSAVKNAAKNAGFGKFRTFLNGLEIEPESAPDVFARGDTVEIRKYDVAG